MTVLLSVLTSGLVSHRALTLVPCCRCPRSWWSITGTWGMSGMRWVTYAGGSWRALTASCRRWVLMLNGIFEKQFHGHDRL